MTKEELELQATEAIKRRYFTESRQGKRRLLRDIANFMTKGVTKGGIYRHDRREISRMYAIAAYRRMTALYAPDNHKYAYMEPNESIVGWVVKEFKSLEDRIYAR